MSQYENNRNIFSMSSKNNHIHQVESIRCIYSSRSNLVEMRDIIYRRTCDLVDLHLKNKGLLHDHPAWILRKSPLGGRGLFASRKIQQGEIIFVDATLVIGPRVQTVDMCVVCFKTANLTGCPNKCGLTICSSSCATSESHLGECQKLQVQQSKSGRYSLSTCLTPLRALFLGDLEKSLLACLAAHRDPVHGVEVDLLKDDFGLEVSPEEEEYMRMVCSVLDANAFEVLACEGEPSLRGLYPLAALMNHCCTPNTWHVFDKDQHMIVRASRTIEEGEEIMASYCRLLWATLTRRCHLLKTKHFACLCNRCKDPTESGTYLSAVICKNCDNMVLPENNLKSENNMVLPVNPLKSKSTWACQKCAGKVEGTKVNFTTAALSSSVANIDETNLREMLEFYKTKLRRHIPESNQVAIELKYRMLWILGYKKGLLLHELSEDLLTTREQFCADILDVLDKLAIGLCKMRGLLLYETWRCRTERSRRRSKDTAIDNNDNEVLSEDTRSLLNEICDIFMFDVAAPAEIRKIWEQCGVKTSWRDYFWSGNIVNLKQSLENGCK